MINYQGNIEAGKEITPETGKIEPRYKGKPFPFSERTWAPNVEIEDNPNNVRVITYNIMADSLVTISCSLTEEQMKKLPYLEWAVRREKILDELQGLDGDIICLQEFERDEEFITRMAKLGYDVNVE